MTQPTHTQVATDRITRRVEEAKSRAAARADRAAETASNAAGSAVRMIKDHPFAAIGGAVVVGAIVSQLLPGKAGKRSRKSSQRVLELAAGAAELALAYGKRASESAAEAGRDGSIRLGHAGHEFGAKASDTFNDLVSNLGDRLGDSSDVARKRGLELAGSAADMARDASTLAARKLRELAAKLES